MKNPVSNTRKNVKRGPLKENEEERKIVFITGSTGRLGRNLVAALLAKRYAVRALVEKKSMLMDLPSGATPYVGDLNDTKVLAEATSGADIVIHLAAIVSEYKAYTEKLMEVNVSGTRNVLDACRSNGVDHLLFTSTVDVYGRSRKGILNEESTPKPSDKYGYSKMLAEKEIESYKDKIYYTIFRMATIYGPGFEHSFFKTFKAVKEGKVAFIGDGSNHLALVHVRDVVSAFLLAIENPISKGKIYNLSDGVAYTQKQLFSLVADMLHVERPKRSVHPLVVKLVAKSKGLDSDELRFLTSNRVIDISKIKKELRFSPKVNIKSAGLGLVNLFLNKYSI